MMTHLLLLVALLQQPSAPFAGAWIAMANNLPTFTLTLTNSNGKVAGWAIFFFPAVPPGAVWSRKQLVDTMIEGDTLSFKFTPPNTQTGDSRPPETFKFVEVSPDRAILTGDRAGEHFEIVLTKFKIKER
jgi:hypothetical protein